jgi:hypothetical protein
MASKKSATWDAAATGCSYYFALPIGVILIFAALFITGGLITGLILLLQQWLTGWGMPYAALLTVGILFTLFALMLPLIAPILHLTNTLQKRYRKARERLHHIHDEQARVKRLMLHTSPKTDEILYEELQQVQRQSQ